MYTHVREEALVGKKTYQIGISALKQALSDVIARSGPPTGESSWLHKAQVVAHKLNQDRAFDPVLAFDIDPVLEQIAKIHKRVVREQSEPIAVEPPVFDDDELDAQVSQAVEEEADAGEFYDVRARTAEARHIPMESSDNDGTPMDVPAIGQAPLAIPEPAPQTRSLPARVVMKKPVAGKREWFKLLLIVGGAFAAGYIVSKYW